MLAFLCFGISKEAEAGFIFTEALVEVRLFIPAVLVVVNVVVSLWVGKVELRELCKYGRTVEGRAGVRARAIPR